MQSRRIILITGLFLALFSIQVIAEEAPLTEEQQKYITWAKSLWDKVDRQQGNIKLPGNVATLNVPQTFYYLNPKDTETVLTEIWGNPPGQKTLGMLFPAGTTPFDSETYGVTIEYEADGYVSDEDAEEIDYDELLQQMKQGTEEASKQRVKQGYEAIELVGWAARPYYDKASHKLYWAKEIKFADDPKHTLNYNIRILGRKGVLVLNFIAGMAQKPVIDKDLDNVLAIANFDSGSKYEDFNPDMDTVAAYGLGALIAGKVALKSGFLVAALLFLKKFAVIILVAIGAFFKKLFGKS